MTVVASVKNFDVTVSNAALFLKPKALEERKEQILQKYRAKDVVDAYNRANMAVENEEDLQDIMDLENHFHVLENKTPEELDKLLKVSFELCITAAKKMRGKNIVFCKMTNFKNKLMHENTNIEIICKLKDKLKLKSNDSSFFNLISALLESKETNLKLRSQYEEIVRQNKNYTCAPILLLESHASQNTALFYEKFLELLKLRKYQAVGIETLGATDDDFDLTKEIAFLKKSINKKRSSSMSLQDITDSKLMKKSALRMLESIQKHEIPVFRLDCSEIIDFIDRNLNIDSAREVLDMVCALRDEHMFYKMALLIDKYDGGVIFTTGGCHGSVLINELSKWLKNLISVDLIEPIDFELNQKDAIKLGLLKFTDCLDMSDIGSDDPKKVEAAIKRFLERLGQLENNVITKPALIFSDQGKSDEDTAFVSPAPVREDARDSALGM